MDYACGQLQQFLKSTKKIIEIKINDNEQAFKAVSLNHCP